MSKSATGLGPDLALDKAEIGRFRANAALDLSPDLVQAIAERAAALVLKTTGSDAEGWVGVDDAATHLACPQSRIYRLVSQRAMPFEKEGARLLFKRSLLDEWVARGGADR